MRVYGVHSDGQYDREYIDKVVDIPSRCGDHAHVADALVVMQRQAPVILRVPKTWVQSLTNRLMSPS